MVTDILVPDQLKLNSHVVSRQTLCDMFDNVPTDLWRRLNIGRPPEQRQYPFVGACIYGA